MGPLRRRPAPGPGLVVGLVLVLPWLGGARALATCEPPDRLQYAELEERFSTMNSFPPGSTVSYICRPGYMRVAGKSLTRTCGEDLQWSPTEKFCTERKCRLPEELRDGFVHVTDLTFGSTATFSCRAGFRLRGTSEITCVIRNEGVDWDRDLPLCERIPCKPPPSIANGHHTEAANYVFETTVTYTCDEAPKGTDPFSLIGSATISCTYDADLNGVWSEEPPQCKVVKCENPKVENGKKKSGFGPSYTYRDSVMFECDPGYVMTGSEVITCGENSTWSPPKPTCKKITRSVCGAPEITHGVVIPAKLVYEGGESVQIKCSAHCTFPHGAEEMTVTCQGQNTWSSLQDCACGPISSGLTPHINYGKVIDGQKPSYSVGDTITIECYTGYTLHGEAQIRYIGENRWFPAVPTCQLSAYITAIICVIVAIIVFLAAFWAYKKFFAQNGKRDSTPCTAEYKICKA
ncbi:LOW QUALITY PROTEIN: membrane cofactor protein [Melopsittacus undulatus]|uniref:LOW QUALITY PROTEIN: membrane cofactor protein n=1 Tax=Melopsittacus undulatus TaxID=13146 RepID=UPI00146D5F9E|nr:LOW QUALITY PROTEIN: membrane cofactor protein [Melopsittacus undulatus]